MLKISSFLPTAQSTPSNDEAIVPVYRCARCEDKGVVRRDVSFGDPLFGKLFECGPTCPIVLEKRAERAARITQQAALPPHYAALTFASFAALHESQRERKMVAYHATRAWAKYGRVNLRQIMTKLKHDKADQQADADMVFLVLTGDVGTGKTGLAAAAVNAMLVAGTPCAYSRVQDVIRRIQSAYSDDKLDQNTELARFADASALVLDEATLSAYTPDRQAIMEAILRARAASMRPTLITTNLSPDAFYANWGERVDVLRGISAWVRCGGQNLRGGGFYVAED